MTLTRQQLLDDLYEAYFAARRHKRNKPYQLRFEERMEENLEELCGAFYTKKGGAFYTKKGDAFYTKKGGAFYIKKVFQT